MTLALACGALSVAFGVVYLFAAGAPRGYLLINVGALALGVIIAAVARIAGMWKWVGAGATTIAIGLLLSAIACFGTPVAGASRWIVVAGLSLQPSLILLPAAMVALAVTMALVVAVAGFVIACIRPGVVPPAPYVEQVVQSSFAIHPLVGLAVVAGLVTMLVPAAGRPSLTRYRRVIVTVGSAQ